MNQTQLKRSLLLLQIETVLTSLVFAMPILNVFFANEIGLSLAEVGLTQAAFTLAVLLLNIPTGWLADRFSRKWCNVLGDIVAAGAFLYYAQAQTLSDVIVAEILIGIGLAFSGGADVGLLKEYADKLKISYQRVTSNIATWRPIAEMAAVSLGGVVGAASPRLAIGLSGVTYFIGAILSFFLIDSQERYVSADKPLKSMWIAVRYALHGHKPLKWSIITYALGREATHAHVWIFTPLLLLAGVPTHILGVAWALNLLAVLIGARAAHHTAHRLLDWQKVSVGAGVFTLSSLALSIEPNLVTIFFYAGFGFVRGWYSATLLPIVQQHAPAHIQSTVVSVAGSLSQLIYIPLVWGLGALADITPSLSIFVSWLIFAPLLFVSMRTMKRLAER